MLKKDILRRKDDFTSIYKKGRSVGERYIVLFYRKNDLSYNRIAFLASKKVGNSIVRHRLTRLVRESFRLHKNMLETGLDIVVVVRAAAKESDYKTIERAFLHLCGLHNILENLSEKND